ncbi:hypothetical protein SH601_16635 [Gracilibacillus sp. S3-1-1]|uniref:Uncharacterized protein n=1 Tax=Gracilibacillus pellucidus TaxID=3095368 RepID=A0ACC6M9S2_9BACI|nr:hypothetical protein [Gracilibacillus sp. S3-1-1]MDX8047591.1 hypothetical protein [Gracilibacillus sp. S3-1-1]
MKLGELLQEAIDMNAYGLQSLIMLVVFEKQVLTLEDEEKELDLYFEPHNAKRLNQILIDYQKKLGIQHEPLFYWVTAAAGDYIVKAESKEQAEFYIHQSIGGVKKSSYMEAETELVQLDQEHHIQARYMLGKFAERMSTPAIVCQF